MNNTGDAVNVQAQNDIPKRVRMLYNPPGIGAGQVTISGKEGWLQLNANGNAPVNKWKVALVGRSPRRRRRWYVRRRRGWWRQGTTDLQGPHQEKEQAACPR